MSLTNEDRKWITKEMAASEERVYKRIKEGALSEVNKRLDGLDGRLDGLDGRLDGLDGRLDGLDGRLDGINGRLDEHGRLIAENMRATGDLRRVAQTLVTDVRAIRADMR